MRLQEFLTVTGLGALLFLGGGCGAANDTAESGAPTTSGVFAVWSPGDELDVSTGEYESREFVHGTILISHLTGTRDQIDAGPDDPSLTTTLFVTVEPDGSAVVDSWYVLLACNGVERYEESRFTPPMPVTSDGTVELALDWVLIQATFSDDGGRFRGSWESRECGGSWDGETEPDDGDAITFDPSGDG